MSRTSETTEERHAVRKCLLPAPLFGTAGHRHRHIPQPDHKGRAYKHPPRHATRNHSMAPSRKKPHVANDTVFSALANGRLKRGSLDILPSLPLDILCEVGISLIIPNASSPSSFRYFVACTRPTFLSSRAPPRHFVLSF